MKKTSQGSSDSCKDEKMVEKKRLLIHIVTVATPPPKPLNPEGKISDVIVDGTVPSPRAYIKIKPSRNKISRCPCLFGQPRSNH